MNRRNGYQARILRSLAIAGASAFVASLAHAEPTASHRTDGAGEDCARPAERGQRLRNEGKLLEAKPLLVDCSAPTCPAIIRVACERWVDDVVSATPSVVVRARDAFGVPVSDVAVRVDGAQVVERLDARPILLDPGSHRFEYSHTGSPVVTDFVVISAGEKEHVLPVRFASAAAAAPLIAPEGSGDPDLSTEKAPAGSQKRTRDTINYPGWTFVGVSLTALGVFAYLGGTGLYAAHSADVSCGSQCPPSRFDDASSRFLGADISLGVALAAAGVSAWFFLTARDGDVKSASRVGRWTVSPGPRGIAVQWGRAF
jgi:hypothetical protein